jgi:hypothetical protein
MAQAAGANSVKPLTLRFIIAGTVIIVAGIAIAVTGAGVGESPEAKAAVVAAAGAGLIVTGILRQFRPPPE